MPPRLRSIGITMDVWKKIMMYSLSSRECLFIFGGSNGCITCVTRIRNISKNGRTNAEWNLKEHRDSRKEILEMGLQVIAEGHSHVDESSLPHPSSIDVRNIPTGRIELICFPRNGSIRAWVIKDSLKETLNNEIELVLK